MSHADLLSNAELIRQANQWLAGLSLEEKIGQMTMGEISTSSPQEAAEHHLGAILAGAGSWPDDSNPLAWLQLCDQYWDSYQEHGVLPPLIAVDAIHGHANVRGATIFPHQIGIGASGSPDLAYQIAKVTREEILATGIDWNLSPNLSVAQDYRWGRTYESLSGDVELVRQFVEALVTGYQGTKKQPELLACAKHWVGDGATANGHDQGDAWISWDCLQKNHIPPFKDAIKAGVMSVMVSFSSWNGSKCHGNPFLIQEVLRSKLGFKGIVVSDWEGIMYLSDDYYLSVAMGVNAGIDMFMVPDNWRQFISDLKRHVDMGTVSKHRINDAVRRILLTKLAYGIPDKLRPSERATALPEAIGCDSHLALAEKAVKHSLVLLKNRNHCLPLTAHQKIAVVGRLANSRGALCGGFTLEWQGTSNNQDIPNGYSIWEAISQRCDHAKLIAEDEIPSPEDYDCVLFVIGENSYAEGLGDIRHESDTLVEIGSQTKGLINVVAPLSDSLVLENMFPRDSARLKHLKTTGIPIVSILISGRPLITDVELEASDAFIAAWLPGSQSNGIIDLLFGNEAFNAKLPFRWPSIHQDISQFAPGYGLNTPGTAEKAVAKNN